jgi:hypothetical protein
MDICMVRYMWPHSIQQEMHLDQLIQWRKNYRSIILLQQNHQFSFSSITFVFNLRTWSASVESWSLNSSGELCLRSVLQHKVAELGAIWIRYMWPLFIQQEIHLDQLIQWRKNYRSIIFPQVVIWLILQGCESRGVFTEFAFGWYFIDA